MKFFRLLLWGLLATIVGYLLYENKIKKQKLALLSSNVKRLLNDHQQRKMKPSQVAALNVRSRDQMVFNEKVLQHVIKASVKVEVNVLYAAYQRAGSWSGSGVVVDREKGLILTNAHVVGRGCVGHHQVLFYEGTMVEAKVRYLDAWRDFAFLEVDPKLLPLGVEEVALSNSKVMLNTPIFIVGNNGGYPFSIHSGRVTNLNKITRVDNGGIPAQTLICSLNTVGGSSGSGVFNSKGQMIGLNYAGVAYKKHHPTIAVALHPAYIKAVLAQLKEGEKVVQHHIGVFLDHVRLDQVPLPDNFKATYKKRFPQARGRLLWVSHFLRGSPAEEVLLPGDLVLAVDGKQLGGRLVDFDLALNQQNGNNIVLTLLRQGKEKQVKCSCYESQQYEIQRILLIGGGFFVESDLFLSNRHYLPLGTLMLSKVTAGKAFYPKSSIAYNLFRYGANKLLAINEDSLQELDDLITLAPSLLGPKGVTLTYQDALGRIRLAHFPKAVFSNEPLLFTFDSKAGKWTKKKLT